jgi:flagellar basal body-associated protein FliL
VLHQPEIHRKTLSQKTLQILRGNEGIQELTTHIFNDLDENGVIAKKYNLV